MNGILAAWFAISSIAPKAKSTKFRSTIGCMPAMAAPTPSATMAASEMGESNTRPGRPLRKPFDLRPVATAMHEIGADDEDVRVSGHLFGHARANPAEYVSSSGICLTAPLHCRSSL